MNTRMFKALVEPQQIKLAHMMGENFRSIDGTTHIFVKHEDDSFEAYEHQTYSRHGICLACGKEVPGRKTPISACDECEAKDGYYE